MSLTQKLAFNTIIQVLGKILATVASVIIVIYLTRYLGPGGYGQYTTILAYLGLFVVLADFGLSIYIAREVPKKEESIEKIVGNVLGLRLVLSIAALILASIIIIFMPYENIIKLGVWAASFSMFFALMNDPLMAIYQINLSMYKASYADVAGRFFTLILTIFFIKLKMGLIAILMAYNLGNLLNLTINIFWVQAHIKIDFKFEYSFWKKIFKEAIPLGLMVISGAIYFRLGIIILSLIKTSEEVGIFGAAYKIIEVLLTFPGMFIGLILPILSLNLKLNPSRFKSIFQKSFNLMIIWIMPIAVIGILMASQIISIIGGIQFQSAKIPLIILFVALIFSFINSPFGTVGVAMGKQKELAWRNIIIILFVSALNLILVPFFSYNGTAIAVLIGEISMLILTSWLIYRDLAFFPNLKLLPKALVSGLIMAISAYLLIHFVPVFSLKFFLSLGLISRTLIFILISVFASIIYLLVLYLMKGYSKRSVYEILGKEDEL